MSNLIVDGGVLEPTKVTSSELADLFRAANERKIFVAAAADGVLTVSPSRTTTRAANRAARQARTSRYEASVLDALAKAGESKIGPLVKEVIRTMPDADPSTVRNDVLQALRSLREQGKVVSLNRNPGSGGSNFRMTWELVVPAAADEASEVVEASSDAPPQEAAREEDTATFDVLGTDV